MESNDKTRQLMAFASGGLIALAAFTLIFWALAWFMPVFLRLGDPPWAPLMPALLFVVIGASGCWRVRIKRRA